MPKSIVILTEKKDQAEKLVAAMGWQRSKGCWTGTFEGANVTVVCAKGHLITLQSPDEVVPGLPWDEPERLLPIPRTFPMKVGDDEPGKPVHIQPRSYVANISKHLKKADEFIIATDSDREGEAIGWSVMEHIGYKGPVRRAWFAAGLDKKSLTEAMANLRDPSDTKSFFRASEARGRSDWAYQFAVRAFTHYASYQCLGANLGRGSGRSRVVSVGRVQTPTLAMIVYRDHEIENFVKKDHFRVSGSFIPVGSDNAIVANYSPEVTEEVIDSQPPGVVWEPSKRQPKEGQPDPLDTPLYVGKAEVDDFKSRLLSAADKSVITQYEEGARSEAPPKTFALTDAQAALVGETGISTGLAQTVFEDLYEQGWTSYARTSKADIPINLYEPSERNSMLGSLADLDEVSSQASIAKDIHNGNHQDYKPFVPAVFSKAQMEHYGIVPTSQKMTKSAFANLAPKKKDGASIKHTGDHMRAAYLLVAKQFIQALYPPAKYTTQTVSIEVPVEDLLGHQKSHFKAKAEKMCDPGWRSAFKDAPSKDTSVPKQIPGNSALLTEVMLKASETKPPSRYTEITLPKEMESIGKTVKDPKLRAILKNSEGIGTPATRKTVIETLVSRGYVEVKGKSYHSTKKGKDLISVVPKWLSNPETTAVWEDYLVKICGERNDSLAVDMRDQFVEKQLVRVEALIKGLIEKHNNNLGEKIEPGPSKVTKKMKDFMKLISESKNIPIPKGALTDPVKAKKFLDENVTQRGPEPSDGQLKLLDKIISNLPDGFSIPEDVRTDRKVTSKFIDENIGKLPPTPGMISFAEKLIAKLEDGVSPPDGVLQFSSVCKAFIDEQTKDWGSKSGSKGKSSKPKRTRSKSGSKR